MFIPTITQHKHETPCNRIFIARSTQYSPRAPATHGVLKVTCSKTFLHVFLQLACCENIKYYYAMLAQQTSTSLLKKEKKLSRKLLEAEAGFLYFLSVYNKYFHYISRLKRCGGAHWKPMWIIVVCKIKASLFLNWYAKVVARYFT